MRNVNLRTQLLIYTYTHTSFVIYKMKLYLHTREYCDAQYFVSVYTYVKMQSVNVYTSKSSPFMMRNLPYVESSSYIYDYIYIYRLWLVIYACVNAYKCVSVYIIPKMIDKKYIYARELKSLHPLILASKKSVRLLCGITLFFPRGI